MYSAPEGSSICGQPQSVSESVTMRTVPPLARPAVPTV